MQVVGVVSDQADAFAQSLEQGKIITTLSADTMADGLACRMPLAESFAMIQHGAERIIRVTDDEVCHAIRIYHESGSDTERSKYCSLSPCQYFATADPHPIGDRDKPSRIHDIYMIHVVS